MIFDNFENDEDLFQAYSGTFNQNYPEIDLSLDDLILERNEKENNKDFSDHYETYQIQVNNKNKTFEFANKENIAMNIMERPRQERKGLKLANKKVKEEGHKLIFLNPVSCEPSANFDVDHLDLNSLRKKIMESNHKDSSSSSSDEVFGKSGQSLEEDPKYQNYKSPIIKRVPNSKLKRRGNGNEYSSIKKLHKEKPMESKIQRNNLDSKDIRDCKKCLFNEQRYSIEDFSNLMEKKSQPKKTTKRSFSVNSIAREIIKASLCLDNPSFQTILSGDHIGMSKEEIEGLTKNCGFCLRDFRLNEIVAETYGCKHSFHKTCLDDVLFALFMDNKPLACPVCRKTI